MKIEKLRKSHKKEMMIGGLIGVSVLSVLIFATTRAKYQTAESINIAKGTINYKPYDFKIIAMYEQNSSGTYTEVTTMSDAKKYKVNESKSYCTLDNVNKDTNAILKTINGEHIIRNLTKNDKCYLYFDKIKVTNVSELIASKTIAVRENFQVLTTNTTGTMYTAYDDDGLSYYYAGAVDDNWVEFAGFYWRIIRINGDGTIRLIYNGATTDQTGEGTQISTSPFISKDNDNAYVGYMYGTPESDTYETTHANTNSSTIKEKLDNWYNETLNKVGIKEHIDINVGFCGDRDSYTDQTGTISGGGMGNTITYYGAYIRIAKKNLPSLKCKNNSDLYTISEANKGNKALTYPVGLITADEVFAAGGKGLNSNYYLYTNKDYWTMTPNYYDSNVAHPAHVYYVFRYGQLGAGQLPFASGIRPVINLKADITFSSGDGTSSNPFVVG